MPLTAGQKLGSYEVIDPIGAGGMGEVYRARDTKLGREVAIKVLPEAFAQNEERLARFEREAKVLAQLNHPGIAHLYGLERSEGVDYLAMELVDGDTLAERIARGPIAVDEALPLCQQIAEALEAAHEKGIIHRDLKPANIKVNPEGQVKVLDFGLAKAFAEETPDSDSSFSPTISRDSTRAGVILGTAAYMSPEQAKGKAVDKRTDIFSFGIVLYEMLTGRGLFSGETISDTLAAILKNEPDWQRLPEKTPWLVKRLLRRCLEKNPKNRLHDIADARLELEESASEPLAELPKTDVAARWKTLLPWAVAVVALLLLAVSLFLHETEAPTPQVSRFVLTDEVDLGVSRPFALSPDGSSLVFAGARGGLSQLYLRPLDRLEATPLRDTEESRGHLFSPNGRWILFETGGGAFYKLSLSDGSVSLLTQRPFGQSFGASWGADDQILIGSNSGLTIIPAAGGAAREPTQVDAKKGETSHRWPVFLPGGEAVIYTRWTQGGIDEAAIEVVTLATGERHVVVERGSGALYTPTGHIVFARDGGLMAASFDPNKQELTGPAVRVIDKVLVQSGTPKLAFSDTGVLVYATGRPARLVWVDREGREATITNITQAYYNPRLAPNGNRLSVSVDGLLWTLDLRRDAFTRLTSERVDILYQVWTIDGDRIVFNDRQSIKWIPADRSGSAETIAVAPPGLKLPGSLSPDGKELAAIVYTETSSDVYIFPIQGDGEPRPFLDSPAYEGGPQFSPDGRFLAYVSNETGSREVYVTPYPGPGPKWQVSTEGGTHPLWNPSGGELFYRNGTRVLSVSVGSEAGFSPSKPALVFEGNYFFGANLTIPNYDVTKDGQRFVMIKEESTAAGSVQVVVNWFEELKRLVPTN